MKKRVSKSKAPQSFAAVHRQSVERIASGLRPVKPSRPPLVQLAWWMVGTAVLGGLLRTWMPLRSDLPESLASLPFDLMLVLTFWGALMAAWAALEASFPDGERGTKWKFGAAGFSWLVGLLLFLLFTPWAGGGYPFQVSFSSCFAALFLIGIVPWIGLGWLIRRNAPLNPGRVAWWAGVSAFLLGLGAVTLHCGSHNLAHVCLEHFLPVLAYSALAGWLGSRWLCAWKRKPL